MERNLVSYSNILEDGEKAATEATNLCVSVVDFTAKLRERSTPAQLSIDRTGRLDVIQACYIFCCITAKFEPNLLCVSFFYASL